MVALLAVGLSSITVRLPVVITVAIGTGDWSG